MLQAGQLIVTLGTLGAGHTASVIVGTGELVEAGGCVGGRVLTGGVVGFGDAAGTVGIGVVLGEGVGELVGEGIVKYPLQLG